MDKINFCGAGELTAKDRRSYERLKKAVLKNGGFTVFEATVDPRAARLFDYLKLDKSLTVRPGGFPWTIVERSGQ